MKDKKHKDHAKAWAGEVARGVRGVNGRDLVDYINKLVDQGKLPKELMASVDEEDPCWDNYKQVGMKKKNGKDVPNCVPEEVVDTECTCFDHVISESEYKGRKVKLNDPSRSNDGKKKFYVYVKNEKGNVIKLGFGDPNMEIKRDDPARRKSFRARHNCDDPGPKYKARYWSCYQWRAGAKVDN